MDRLINEDECDIFFDNDTYLEFTDRRPGNPKKAIEDIFHLIRMHSDQQLEQIYKHIVITDNPNEIDNETVYQKLTTHPNPVCYFNTDYTYAYKVVVDLKDKNVSVCADINTDIAKRQGWDSEIFMYIFSLNTFDEIRHDRNALRQVLSKFDITQKPIGDIL